MDKKGSSSWFQDEKQGWQGNNGIKNKGDGAHEKVCFFWPWYL